MSDRMFRVLLDGSKEARQAIALGCPREVPWGFLAPHEERAQGNHAQSLQRLNERGGLSPAEMMCVIENRKLWPITENDAQATPRLIAALAAYNAKLSDGKDGAE